MKGKLCKIIGILIAAMLLSTMVAFPAMAGVPDEPHAANAMWIEPSSVDLNTADHDVGYKFNVTVWVNITVPSYAWQVKLLFCSECLNATRIGYTHVDKSEFFDGLPTTPVVPIIDNVEDYAWHAETLTGPVQRDPGFGSLIWIEFVVIKVPAKGERLDCVFDIETTYATGQTWVLDPGLMDIPLTPYNAGYSFVWVPPGPALLSVHNPGPYPDPSPPSFFFDRGTDWNCTWFTVDIYLDISFAWFITNASFALGYNTALIDTTPANITIYAFPGPNEVTIVHGVPDKIYFILRNPCGLEPIGGHVLIATIDFHIHNQSFYPGVPEPKTSPLVFQDVILFDHFYDIPCGTEDGLVTVEGYLIMTLPWLEVEPAETTMGPEPVVCETFDVDIVVKELDERWLCVAVQFYLLYDESLIEPVAVTEGDFFQPYAPYGTLTVSVVEPPPPGTMWHVLFGTLILPNATGEYDQMPPWPEGNGTIATITFHVIHQSYPYNFTSPLHFEPVYDGIAGLSGMFIDADANLIPHDLPVDGAVNIVTALPGRIIDVYTQYPAPFGGQGPNNPSDMFGPQRIVYLYANVTYNYWPVNNKDVGFEIEGPFDQDTGLPLPRYQIWYKGSARTDKDGVAWIKYQLPWPCEDPEGLFGKWKVTATVDICEVIVMDTLTFDYQYVVTWKTVTVDREPLKEYKHCEWVGITVKFKSKAQQPRWVLITAVIEDNLQTPIGIAWTWILVGGAEPCTWIQYEVTLWIHVPQHAFAGPAWIHVNAFTDDPTVGGVPWCPEYEPTPEIYIQPY